MGPAQVSGRGEREPVHLKRMFWAVVDIVLCWDANRGVREVYRCGLVLLWVNRGVTSLWSHVRG